MTREAFAAGRATRLHGIDLHRGMRVLDVVNNMTEIGLVKTITISYFKAHISEELRKVRRGARIVICDRDNPIAEVVPYKTDPVALAVRQPQITPFELPRPTFKIKHDPLEYLLEDREKR